MRNQPETVHEYNIPRLNWWFLLSGAAFLGCLLLMVWVDYSGGRISWLGLRGDRQWKNYQRAFYNIEKQRLAADAKAAELRASEAGLEKLRAELGDVEKQLAAKQDEKRAAQAEVEKLTVSNSFITREFTMEKATRDEYRSFYEAALERNQLNEEADEVRVWQAKTKTQNAKVDQLDLAKQDSDRALADAQTTLTAIIGHEDQLQRQIKRMTGNIELVAKRLTQLADPLVQTVVNAPLVEFAVPTYKVEQIIAENHHVSVNFTTVPRVDRCITCHKGIDRKDPAPDELEWRAKNKIESIEWSKLEQPLTSHPQLDLYVSDTSPHPASKFGCTVCHWGWDRETSFARAGHSPDAEEKHPYTRDEQSKLWTRVEPAGNEDAEATGTKVQPVSLTQEEAWIKNYDWYHEHYNLQPMRQQKFVEASCLKCHAEQTSVRGAERLDHGRRLVEQLGCWSCHKMKLMETYATHVVAKGEDLDSIVKFYDVDADELRRVNNLSAGATLNIGQEVSIPIRTLRKPGPSLYKVAGKTNKEWTRKWLANPVAFRPNTYMPRFWGLDNNPFDGEKSSDRNNVEISAVTEFLFAVSEAAAAPPPPVQADAENGRKLVGQLGCFGCHVVDEDIKTLKPPADLAKFMDEWQYRRYRSQGPQLAGTGSKTTTGWLYAWLKNPKSYHPETKMPDLRLNDQEAADIAEYLVTLRKPATDTEPLASIKSEVLDAVTLEYLQVTLPRKEAEARLNNLDEFIEMYFVDAVAMAYYKEPARLTREQAQVDALNKEYEETFDDAIQRKAQALADQIAAVNKQKEIARAHLAGLTANEKKQIFLGSKIVGRYGCFACHNIKGFEDAKPIGTELSEWGSKTVDKLDFGLLEIEHSREAWLLQKLRASRSYDLGRIGVTRNPQELLRMPTFNLTDEQREQVITVIAGMTDEKLQPNEPRRLTPADYQMERGRWMVKELNCQGCHVVEGHGGAIKATGLPAGMEPPWISGAAGQLRQGQRTQPDWLFHFLKGPQTGQIRPWLDVRMPTFGLSDAEANVLVRYFALEGRTQFPYQSPQINTDPDHLAAGKQLFTQLKCALCHIVEGKALGKPLAEIPAEDLPRLAPNLSLAHSRLQRDFLVNRWLPDPLSQVPGTRMPQFEYGPGLAPNILGGDGRKQVEALVDYVLSLGAPIAPAAPPAPPATETAAAPATQP